MITTICCIYCCKQLVYSSTRSLVNFSKFLCLLLKQLVHLSTRLLVNLTTFQQTKVMKKNRIENVYIVNT